MTKFILALLLFFCITSATKRPAIAPELELLKKEVIKDILTANVNEAELTQVLSTMKSDGSWPDILYTDQTRGSWPVVAHLTRLNDLAVMHYRKGGTPALREKILLGLDYWFKNDFICPNWWYPQIGVPKVLGPTMLLMENYLSPAQKAAGVKILDRARIALTGQNKVWLSGNVIYKSLLTDSVDLVKAAVAAIQGEINVSQGEGIQIDNSFHQHGPQLQFGNYGAAFASDMLKWGNIFQPTNFRFSEQKVEILRNYLLEGMKWIVWKDQMDISACGRQLFPAAQIGKAKMIETIFGNMAKIDPRNQKAYDDAMQDFEGNKFFWRSDLSVYRTKDFYTSVKMCSRMVGGAESCNEENLLGYHLADGANYYYQSGREYTEIFPFWDWKRIPGTTTFHDEAPLPRLDCSGYRINSNFVGGIDGMATMLYNRDSLLAQKSWFFFDNVSVCLGAGINSLENKEVNTTINQSFLQGKVQVNDGASTKILPNGAHNLSNVSWVIHDNWAYYFPKKTSVELGNQRQNGDWHKVLQRMPPNEIKADIFTLTINHQKKPKDAAYAYYVIPKANPDSIAAISRSVSIIENSPRIQAVEDLNSQLVKIVFIKPGTVKTRLLGSVTADQPCVVTIYNGEKMSSLVYADPGHDQKSGKLMIDGLIRLGTYDKSKNITTIDLTFPQGAQAGGGTAVLNWIKPAQQRLTGASR